MFTFSIVVFLYPPQEDLIRIRVHLLNWSKRAHLQKPTMSPIFQFYLIVTTLIELLYCLNLFFFDSHDFWWVKFAHKLNNSKLSTSTSCNFLYFQGQFGLDFWLFLCHLEASKSDPQDIGQYFWNSKPLFRIQSFKRHYQFLKVFRLSKWAKKSELFCLFPWQLSLPNVWPQVKIVGKLHRLLHVSYFL